MTPGGPRAQWHLAAWWLVAGLAGVVLHVGWLSLPWPLVHDAPIMHYVAWRIGQGAVPYRDVFDMNFPGVYLIHLGVLRAFGSGDAGWRLFDLAWLAMTSAVIAWLAGRWGRVAAVGGALSFAAYHLGGGAWQAGQRDFLLCVFLLAGALGIARWGEGGPRKALLLAGLTLGAGVMVKPQAALMAAALTGLVLLAPRPGESRWRAAAIFVGGLVVVPVVIVTWLGTIGALGPWREITFGYLVPLYSRLAWSVSWTAQRWMFWLPIAIVAAVSVGHAVLSRRFAFRHTVLLTGIGYGILHYLAQGKGWEYHLYPLGAFACALLFSEVAAALRARPTVAGVPLVAGLALVVVLIGWRGTVNVDAHWIWDKERQVRLLAYDLAERLRPGDRVQVLDTTEGGVHALFRLGVVQPTRFLYDFHFFHDTGEPAIRALRAELVSGLDRQPPRFIVLFKRGWPSGRESRIAGFPELASRLEQRYDTILRPDYILYAKRHGS